MWACHVSPGAYGSPEKVSRTPGAGITSDCEQLKVGDGNGT